MPIKRNCYIKTNHDLVVGIAEAYHATMAKPRKGFATADEAIAAVAVKRATLQSKREARYTLADGVAIFRSNWPALHKEHFPGTIPDVIIASRHFPMIKHRIVEPLRSGNTSVSDFLSFMFEQWEMFRYSRAFKKFKYYPQTPAINWLLKYSALYLFLYNDFLITHSVRDDNVEKSMPVTTDNSVKLRRIVQEADSALKTKDRELAQLRAENKRLQSIVGKPIPSHTKASDKQLPDWD